MVQPQKDKKPAKTRVGITIQCVVGEDDDLIKWYENIPHGEGAKIIKDALRRSLGIPSKTNQFAPILGVVTEEDLSHELDKLTIDFRAYVQSEIQRALNSLDYRPQSQYAPVESDRVAPETLEKRKQNIMKEEW